MSKKDPAESPIPLPPPDQNFMPLPPVPKEVDFPLPGDPPPPPNDPPPVAPPVTDNTRPDL